MMQPPRSLLFLFALALLFTLTACPPDDDDDNDDATPADDDSSVDDDDDDTIDDDTGDDDTTDDDSTDDDTIDDDTGDDDTIDDDTGDDDTIDDDTTDDDTGDDDTIDDDTADDDIVVQDKEYIFGGVADYFDLATTDDGPMFISIKAGGRSFLYTIDEQDIAVEEFRTTLTPVDLQLDANGVLHMLAREDEVIELKHLWRVDDVWHEETVAGTTDESVSEMAIDADGNIHLCQNGWELHYYTNASGEWTDQLIRSMETEPAFMCRMQTGPDDKVYMTYMETWYDGHGYPYDNIFLLTKNGTSWASRKLTDDGSYDGAYVATDDNGHVELIYEDEDQLIYGYLLDGEWTFETVPDAPNGFVGLWRIEGTPTIVFRNVLNHQLSRAVRNEGGWAISSMGIASGFMNEFTPTTDGHWRILYRDSDSDGLYYLNDLTDAWTRSTIYLEPEVYWSVSSGVDSDGNRFLLANSNQGMLQATQTDDGWQVDPFSIGVTPLDYAVAMIDEQGVTHIAGYSSPNIVYANNREGEWQSETVDVASANSHVLALRPDGEPLIAYIYLNHLYCALHGTNGWTVEQVPETETVDSWTFGLGGNDDGDVFICYGLNSNNDIKCARRHAGQWTINTIDNTSFSTRSTQGLTVDANGEPHYIFNACNYKYGCIVHHAVLHNGSWEIEDISEGIIDDAGLLFDEQGVAHLALAHYSTEYRLYYGTDATGEWRISPLASSVGYRNILRPTLLADGAVQILYRRGGALWRAIVASPTR